VHAREATLGDDVEDELLPNGWRNDGEKNLESLIVFVVVVSENVKPSDESALLVERAPPGELRLRE